MRIAVITHFSDEFLETTIEFYEYFLKIKKIHWRKIHFYTQEHLAKGLELTDFLIKLVEKDSPLVIYYGGHGVLDGWQLSSRYRSFYSESLQALREQKQPLIFINDCCYGMAPEKYLHLLRCQYLLLGLSPKTLPTEGPISLVPGIIQCWQASQPANPALWVEKREELTSFILDKSAKRLRRGAELDYLCYPKTR